MLKRLKPAAILVIAAFVAACGGGGSTGNSNSTYVVTTLAGAAGQTGSSDGSGTAALFDAPAGLAIDGSGTIYVADYYGHTIRKITSTGVVTTLAGTAGQVGAADGNGALARFSNPSGLAIDSAGNLYVADTNNSTIRKITSAGSVSTYAGDPLQSGASDGAIATALFQNPYGLAFDTSGVLYVSEGAQTVRKITSAGIVSTVAGAFGLDGYVDGAGAAARFRDPLGIAIDAGGSIYIADRAGQMIRKLTSAGTVSTFAGATEDFGSVDGQGGAARFQSPFGVAVDSSGNVYVADTDNHIIRKITPSGLVSTIAGTAGQAGAANGTGAAARFDRPRGIAIGSDGTIYVTDTGNNTLRKITVSR